jgi:putative transposase
MPRRARLRIAGMPLHVIQRGNNRGACFFADHDYRAYLQHLDELAAVYACAVHAYVLMTNHVHVLLTPQRPDSVSLLMKHLGQRYVQYVNRVYGRSGTLWAGRFRSSIVQSEGYLLRCQRYIELNPVRAGMVEAPEQYRWSSHAANALGKADTLVTPHEVFLALGETESERRNAYRALFRERLAPRELEEIRVSANAGYALGNERFREEIAAVLGRRAGPGTPGRPAANRDEGAQGQGGLF